MNEEEARTKWCPMVQVIPIRESFMQNRDIQETEPANYCCIASDCMMWREHKQLRGDITGLGSANATFETVGGYCGLAGKR